MVIQMTTDELETKLNEIDDEVVIANESGEK